MLLTASKADNSGRSSGNDSRGLHDGVSNVVKDAKNKKLYEPN